MAEDFVGELQNIKVTNFLYSAFVFTLFFESFLDRFRSSDMTRASGGRQQ